MANRKICLMSGASKNSGDALIEKRSHELLHRIMPDYDICILKRLNEDYSDKIEMLNSFKAIIFAGGPIYQNNIYPNALPFVRRQDLLKLKSPLFFIGGGCKCNAYEGKLSKESKFFFDYGTLNNIPLGCRDFYTYRFLKHQGYTNLMMTGCPAWYHPDYIDTTNFRHYDGVIKKICISEPANLNNLIIFRDLILFLNRKYKEAEIIIVIHEGIRKEVKKLFEALYDRMKLYFVDISGSSDGFSIYDNCDLHVGFRVHAHIYNLSIRNYSILINEDVRGRGVNETLGLESIDIERPSFREKRLYGNFYIIKYDSNNSCSNAVVNHVEDCLETAESTNYESYKESFRRMNGYYSKMKNHIEMIYKFLGDTE